MEKNLPNKNEYNILAIETTGKEASVALINKKGKVFSEASREELNHLKNLVPMIDDLLIKSEIALGDVTHIAVSEGPGSFTGIRIGVTTARAFAQTMGIKIIGVPTLKSFSQSQDLEKFLEEEPTVLVCPIFDARRNQIYGAGFIVEKLHELHEIIPDGAYDITDFLEELKSFMLLNPHVKVRFYGDGVLKYKEKIIEWENQFQSADFKEPIEVTFAQQENLLQNAVNTAKLALKLLGEGKEKEHGEVSPVYLRKAEAEIKLEQSIKGKG